MNSDYTTVALVTGATSGIGRAIACRLLSEGMTVFGIGRNAAGAPQDPHFQLLSVDLTDLRAVEASVRSIDAPVSLLVNAAGVAYYGPHETLSPAQIAEMVAVNVTAPLTLCNLLLPKLRACAGTIINISSVTAKRDSNTHGCAYGATKAALSNFSGSLFEECRKSGLRVITLHPDMTDTALYRNADFAPDASFDCHLLADEIADAVWEAYAARSGLTVTDITIRPQRNVIRRKPASDAEK